MTQSIAVLTQATNFRKARSVNSTASSFASILMQLAVPEGDAASATGRAVFDLISDCPSSADATQRGTLGGPAQNGVLVMPYSVGANNDQYSVRVYGWKFVPGTATATGLWRPFLLVEMACTATSTDIGVAGGIIAATEMFADTVALTTGNDDVSVDLVSPTGDVAGHWQGDLKGAQKLEFTFKTNVAQAPTSMNAIFSLL